MKIANSNRSYIKSLFLILIVLLYAATSAAQPVLPQRTLTVSATQPLHFGTFGLIGTTGGSITVGYDGIRTSSGGVFLSGLAPASQPAIFDIKLCQGRNVTITFTPSTLLRGSNGGSFTLQIGPTEKGVNGAIFAIESNCNFVTVLRVGGTLSISGTSPPGIYTGSFEISFDQQ